MNLLEIVLLCTIFLYAVVLHRALTNIDVNEKKIEIVYKDCLQQIEIIRQKHNSLVDGQTEITDIILNRVSKELENANQKHIDAYRNFLTELEQVKKFISQGFLRR